MKRLLQRYRHTLGLILTLVVFCLAVGACRYMLSEVGIDALKEAVLQVPYSAQGLALVAAAISYCMLLGYEWSASHYAGVRISLKHMALVGLTAMAIGNALGFSMLTGGSVRFRLYSRYGLHAIQIVYMTLFVSLSMGVALPTLAAIMALTDLTSASAALHLSPSLLFILCIAVLAGYLAAAFILRLFLLKSRPNPYSRLLGFGGWTVRIPGVRLALIQFLITALDIVATSTVLYVLLPVPLPYGAFLTVYLLAISAGVLSHVPGGVGVFEAVLLAAFGTQLGSPQETAALAAALLFYRLIYVILPLILACLVLAVSEGLHLLKIRPRY